MSINSDRLFLAFCATSRLRPKMFALEQKLGIRFAGIVFHSEFHCAVKEAEKAKINGNDVLIIRGRDERLPSSHHDRLLKYQPTKMIDGKPCLAHIEIARDGYHRLHAFLFGADIHQPDSIRLILFDDNQQIEDVPEGFISLLVFFLKLLHPLSRRKKKLDRIWTIYSRKGVYKFKWISPEIVCSSLN